MRLYLAMGDPKFPGGPDFQSPLRITAMVELALQLNPGC